MFKIALILIFLVVVLYDVVVYSTVKEAKRLHSKIADWLGIVNELSGKGITVNDVAKARDNATATLGRFFIREFTLKYGSPKCAFLGYTTIFGNNFQWKIKINEESIEFVPNSYYQEDLA